MPILKHAIKKIRVDRRRAEVNKKIKTRARKMVKQVKLEPTSKTLQEAFSALDRAVKKRVLPGSRVDRIKSRLSKLLPKEVKKTTKKATKTK